MIPRGMQAATLALLIAGLVAGACSRTGGGGADPAGLGPRGADPGPTLKAESGAIEPVTTPALELTAEAGAAADGHFILRAALPAGGTIDRSLPWDLRVEGPRHGLACVARGQLWLRLVGADAPDAPLGIAVRAPDRERYRRATQPVQLVSIRLSTPAGTGEARELRRGFFEALAESFDAAGRRWPAAGRRAPQSSAMAAGPARSWVRP